MQIGDNKIRMKDVSLTVPFSGGSVDLLKNISLDLNVGERVGVIGRNGAGKTVLLKVASQIYSPSSGVIESNGSVISLFNISSGINRNWTGRQNAEVKLLMYGIHPSHIGSYIEDIRNFAKIDKYFDSPVKHYSAGMSARLSFAIITSLSAEVLVLDEWISVGDASFKESATERFNSKVSSMGCVLFCTHSPDILKTWATKVIWMDGGEIVTTGAVQDVLDAFHESLRLKK